jgi:hypothetical protein
MARFRLMILQGKRFDKIELPNYSFREFYMTQGQWSDYIDGSISLSWILRFNL